MSAGMISSKVGAFKKPLPLIVGLTLGVVTGLTATHFTLPTPAPAGQLVAAAPVTQEAKEGIKTLRAFSEAFEAVADKARPSVVSIVVEKHQERSMLSRQMPNGHPNFRGQPNPFGFFFDDGDEGEAPMVKGGGTGMVIRSDGMILTNNHVVEDAETIKVYFNDGREFDAKVKGTDPRTDVAVIQIDARNLPAITLGDSEATRVGEWVVAMGNPYGFDYTVTAGIVSAKSRKVTGGRQYEDFIQTDASINPGNSGGPLLNLDGEVIGINTMIAGIGTGIGFAIPSNLAKNISSQLMKDGKVVRPWMGVGIQSVSDDMTRSLNLSSKSGALVNQVYEGSPAEKAGLKRGDVIVELNDKPVKDGDALVKTVLETRVGEEVKLDVVRDGKPVALKLVTAVMPDDSNPVAPVQSGTARLEALGLTVQTVDEDLARKLGMRTPSGVVITALNPSSPAAEAGLRKGDVVLEVNRQPVDNAAAFNAAASNSNNGAVLLLVARDGNTFFVGVRLKS